MKIKIRNAERCHRQRRHKVAENIQEKIDCVSDNFFCRFGILILCQSFYQSVHKIAKLTQESCDKDQWKNLRMTSGPTSSLSSTTAAAKSETSPIYSSSSTKLFVAVFIRCRH